MENRDLIKEVADQKLRIKQLEQELQTKTQLISLISHNFSGVSNNLIWIVEALENGDISGEMFKALLPELKRDALNNNKAIESTINWVKSQHDSFVPEVTEISVPDLVDSLKSLLSIELKAKNIKLNYQESVKEYFSSDQALITFILVEITQNAIKYSQPDSIINFGVRKTVDEGISFIIKDSGVGMSDQVLNNLFTLKGSPYLGTAKEKGTGLSLIIANDFAKLLGGHIKIHSIDGNGTEFELELPGLLLKTKNTYD